VFIEAKDDGGGGDNWTTGAISHVKLQAPVKSSSPPTNQHPVFYRPDALPVTQPTVSKHWREKYHIPWTCLPQAHLWVFQLYLWPLIAPWGRVAVPLISPLMLVPQSPVIWPQAVKCTEGLRLQMECSMPIKGSQSITS